MNSSRRIRQTMGFTTIELIFVGALAVVIAGTSVPFTLGEVDDARTVAAARHLASRLQLTRAQAALRSARVALRFEEQDGDFVYRSYMDGNGNGVLARDILAGIDTALTAPERVGQRFPGVRFGLMEGVTGVERTETLNVSDDPVQIGSANMLSFSPDGSASSGTVYIRGRRRQTAVRVLGASGRVRTLAFDFAAGVWRSQ
jgi:Tfp pilus assembly protein FimT